MKQSFVGKAACRFVKNSSMQTLACTELSVFAVRRQLPPFYTDAMSVLAERAVLACRRPLRDIFS